MTCVVCRPSCQNGGTCVLGSCECVAGFIGTFCQLYRDSSAGECMAIEQCSYVVVVVVVVVVGREEGEGRGRGWTRERDEGGGGEIVWVMLQGCVVHLIIT